MTTEITLGSCIAPTISYNSATGWASDVKIPRESGLQIDLASAEPIFVTSTGNHNGNCGYSPTWTVEVEGRTLDRDQVGIMESTKLAVWQGAALGTLNLKFTGTW